MKQKLLIIAVALGVFVVLSRKRAPGYYSRDDLNLKLGPDGQMRDGAGRVWL